MFMRFTMLFSGVTLLSRVLGFIRDMLLASIFGTGLYADVFTVAFRLPNLFRSIFAEGALSAAFVPIFSKKFAHDGLSNSLRFANSIFILLVSALTVLTLLFEVFMPYVVRGIAPGFEVDPYKFELTVMLTRITIPYLFFVSLVAFYSCILNSVNEFFSLAFSPILLNVVMIVGIYFFGEGKHEKVIAFAWTVFLGGLLQLIVIIRATMRRHVFPVPKLPAIYGDDVKTFFRNITPAVVSSGVSQINIWIGTIIATTLPGAASILYFADRIIQLPVALVGVSIGTVILPALSKAIRAKDTFRSHHLQNRSIEMALALTLPCLIVLMVVAKPVVLVLFQRGAFEAADTGKTAATLFMLALGLPAYVLNKILVSSFFANEETKAPLRIAILCVVVNITGNLLLMGPMEYVGIAFSTALSGWLNTVLLIADGYVKRIFKFDRAMLRKVMRIAASCLVLLGFLYGSLGILSEHITAQPILAFTMLMVLAGAVYVLAIFATRAYSIKELKELL